MNRRFAGNAGFFCSAALLLAGCGGSVTRIASARALAVQTPVTVEGFLTVASGTFASARLDQGFAAQDETAGIYVSVASKIDLAVGQKVRVTGKVADANKMLILQAEASAVTAVRGSQLVTPTAMKTREVNAATEGLLVRVTGKVTRPITDDSPYGYKLYVDDGSGEIQIFLHISAGFDASTNAAYVLGKTLTVTGFAGRYEAEFEVNPRAIADIVSG